MFDVVTTEELRRLARTARGHKISMYLPTHSLGPATAQDPIRLRQLVDRARRQLVELGMRGPDADTFLAPATTLIGDVAFWDSAEAGLAVLLDAEAIRTFRLERAPAERSVVADRFQLRPLLPAVRASDTFWILALSQHDVRLLRGSRTTGMERIDLGEMPRSLEVALRFDDRERQLQSHASTRVGSGGVGMTMHGQGGAKDTTDEERSRFCQIVDEHVRTLVGGSGDPMVLAGERRLLDDFRKASHLDHVVPTDVVGNPDNLADHQLAAAAWEVAQDALEQEMLDDIARFGAAVEHRTNSLDETIVAAVDGRVDMLMVPLGINHHGTFDADRRLVVDHPDGTAGIGDLYDLAVAETLLHGGRVHAVDPASVPGPGPVAATLRF